MSSNNLYGTKAARIVLDGIEAYLAGKEVVDLNSNKITIEHIMPQTLSPDWRHEIGQDDDTHRRYVDTLGNLTLTGLNSELGNMSFAEKRKIYSESGISMNREIAKCDRWSSTEIQMRSGVLADYAIKLWPMRSI